MVAANPAYQALFGYDEEAIVSHSFAVIFPEEHRAQAEEQHRALFASQDPPHVFEAEVRRKDGSTRSVEARADFVIEGGQPTVLVSVVRDVTDRRVVEAALKASEEWFRALVHEASEIVGVWLDAIMTNLLDVPEVAGIVTNMRDVTEQKRLESDLRHLALHDPLTGLPNRTLPVDRMDQALRLATTDGHRVGLLFLDLDYFKHVNDAFGHAVGDLLLHAVADRVQLVVQVTDTLA